MSMGSCLLCSETIIETFCRYNRETVQFLAYFIIIHSIIIYTYTDIRFRPNFTFNIPNWTIIIMCECMCISVYLISWPYLCQYVKCVRVCVPILCIYMYYIYIALYILVYIGHVRLQRTAIFNAQRH